MRVLTDDKEYRFPSRQWVSYNMDKLYAAGVPIRVRGHDGLNHQKLVLFYANTPASGPVAPLSVFGSSNWTTPSANQQQEHNYFTLKPWIFDFFEAQFMRKWCSGNWAAGMPAYCNGHLNPVGSVESTDFVPLAADKPINLSPADASVNLTATGITLKWDPGYYGQIYDIYFGVDPNPPLYKANQALGPVDYNTPKTKKSLALPALQPGTTYYWRIVSKTMAGMTSKGPTWSFTTKGTPPPPPPPPAGATTQVIWAKDVHAQTINGLWSFISDPTAAGGYALWNQDKGKSKISPALASPTNFFEATFNAMAGVPYHVWVRHARAVQLDQQRFGERAVQRLGRRLRFADQPDWHADRRRVRAAGRHLGIDQRLGLGRQRLRQHRPRHLLRHDRLAHHPHPAANRRRGDRSDRDQPGHLRPQRAGRQPQRRDHSRQHGQRHAEQRARRRCRARGCAATSAPSRSTAPPATTAAPASSR